MAEEMGKYRNFIFRICLLNFFFVLLAKGWGQASEYSFAASTGTYTAITGGTVIITGTTALDSWVSSEITIPSFNFNGITYTTAWLTSNGLLTLGGTVPSAYVYSGISSGSGSGICICPFNADLDRVNSTATTEIRWQTIGNEVIFQWKQFKRYNQTENFDFQVRLNTSSGVVKFVYQINSGPDSGTSYFPQVGIRTSSSDYKNFSITDVSGIPTWASPTSTGNANNTTCRFTSANNAKAFATGQTYTFTPPSCRPPSAITTSAITDTTATIKWTASASAPSSGYEYEVRTSGAAGSGATGRTTYGTTSAGVVTKDITGLSGSTTYTVYVRSNCSNDDLSSWVSGTFKTLCVAITDYPWTEGFEGVAIPSFPNCWFKENGDWVTSNNSNNTYDADARSGTQFLRESYSATNEYIWTPGFQLTAGLSYDFSFWWAGDEKTGWTGDVFYNTSQVSTSATQFGSTFVSSGTTTTKTYTQFSKTFVTPSTGTYYFAIRINANSTPWYISFDDFRMEPTPSCIVPTALTSSAVTANTATISWTASTSNPTSGYDIYYSTTNTAPVAGTTPSTSVAAGTTSANLSSLTASTTYYFWVRSNCDGTDKSSWAGYGTFTTACVAISSFPWTENFENGVPPLCWDELRSPSSSHGWETNANGVSGNCARFNSYINASGNVSTLSSPILNLTGLIDPILKFEYKNPTGGDFSVKLSTDGGATYPNILASGLTNKSSWTAFDFNLTTYIGSNVKIALVGTSNYGNGDAYIYVDSLRIEHTPPPGTSTLSAGAGSEPATISSLTNTQGSASLNFDFTFKDDGATPATDVIASQISQIVIKQGTGNNISSWSDAILGAELTDGTKTMTGTINASNINFSSIPNTSVDLGYIADNAEKTYTLKIWLKTTLGGTLPTTIDGKSFVFEVDNASFTFATGGLAASQSVNSDSTKNLVNVEATKLVFQSSKPPSSATCNTNFNVSVDAVDANGNRDINNTASVLLSLNSGSGSLSSSSGLTKSLSSGTYAWTDIKFTPGGTIKIQASANNLTDTISENIAVSCSAPASAPTLYNYGSTTQLAFNNSYVNTSTPTFRASATHSTSFNSFQIEINTTSGFTGTARTQTFSGTYTSVTQYDLTCNSLSSSLPTTNNTTYFVRVRASSDGGLSWSSWSTGLYSFTYKTSGEAEWYQVHSIQLATTTKTEDVIPNIPLNRSFETGTLDNWTETSTSPVYIASTKESSHVTDGSFDCKIQCGNNSTNASWVTGNGNQRSQTVNLNNISAIKWDWYAYNSSYKTGWCRPYVSIAGTKIWDTGEFNSSSIHADQTYTNTYSGNQTFAVGNYFYHANQSGTLDIFAAYFDNIRFYGITTEVAQSEGVLFSSFTDGTTWGTTSWTTAGANGSAKIQVEYWNGSAWAFVPDGALSGNSSGFSSSPIDISALNTTTYSRIRLRINYTYSSGRPSLASWKISPTFGNQLSDIISSSGEMDNIQYINYQAASGLTTSNAIKIGTFTIRDGGSSSPDNDNKTTTLTDIGFSVENHPNIRAMAIFDGSTNLKEVTSVSASTSFNSISNLSAPDNGTKSFDVYATFKSNVTDNQQIKLSVSSATSSTSGSMFATSNAGGAVTSVTGNKNRIIVTATKLVFETNLPPATVPLNDNFGVKTKAVDANNNIDVDAIQAVTLAKHTGSGVLSSAALTQNLVAGEYQWNDVSYNTVQEFKIKASATGLTDGISILINCIDVPGDFSITAPINASSCNGNITISWNASSNVSSYDLYYSTGYNSDPMSCLSPLTNVSSPYTYNASSPLTLYKFQILAHNSVGQTWSSNVGTDSTRSSHAWIGGTSSNWSTPGNWCGGSIPSSTSDVIIFPGTLYQPTLTAESNVRNISIESGASLNTADKNINIYGNWLNNGSLSGTGTATFRGSATTQTIDNGTQEFYNLTLNKPSGTVVLNNHALLKNNLTLTSGTLDANDFDITLEGNWTNNGSFLAQNGTVNFVGSGTSTISRLGTSEVIFFDGFENGNQGWTMQNIANNTDWRIQAGTLGSTTYEGSYSLATYKLKIPATPYSYCMDCEKYCLDVFKNFDLSYYSNAELSFYYKIGSTSDRITAMVLVNGETKFEEYNKSSFTSGMVDLSPNCGKGRQTISFRFYLGSPTGLSNPGFIIDNVSIKAKSNYEYFNNVVFNKSSGGILLDCAILSKSDFEIRAGNFNANGKYIELKGDFINNGTYVHNNNEIRFIGDNNQEIKGASNTTFYNIVKNNFHKLTIGNPLSEIKIKATNQFEWINNGDEIVVGNGSQTEFIINGDLFIHQNCILTLNDASTTSIERHYKNHGTLNPNNGTIKFHGNINSNIIREPGLEVYREDFETGSSGWTLGSSAGNTEWRRQSGYGYNSDYDLAIYDLEFNFPHGYNWNTTSTISIDASKQINLTGYTSARLHFYYRIKGNSDDFGTVIIKDQNNIEHVLINNMYNEIEWKSSGEKDISQFGNQVITLIFRFSYKNINTTSMDPGFCIDDILISTTSVNSETFNNISVVKDNYDKSALLWGPIIMKGNMLIDKGNFNSAGFSFPVGGNWTVNGTSTFTHKNNTITFNGIQNQTIINGTSTSFYNILVNKTETAILNINILKLDKNLTLSAGTLDANNQNIEMGGHWLNNGGVFNPQSQQVKFCGTADQNITSRNGLVNPFYTIEMNKEGSLILQDSLTLNKDLWLIKGQLNANTNKNIRLKGDWIVGNGTTSGTFSPGTAMVTFNGTSPQTINKRTNGTVNLNDFTFYDIKIDGTNVTLWLKSAQYKINTNNLYILPNKVLNVEGQP